jgi:hypothetical protein
VANACGSRSERGGSSQYEGGPCNGSPSPSALGSLPHPASGSHEEQSESEGRRQGQQRYPERKEGEREREAAGKAALRTIPPLSGWAAWRQELRLRSVGGLSLVEVGPLLLDAVLTAPNGMSDAYFVMEEHGWTTAMATFKGKVPRDVLPIPLGEISAEEDEKTLGGNASQHRGTRSWVILVLLLINMYGVGRLPCLHTLQERGPLSACQAESLRWTKEAVGFFLRENAVVPTKDWAAHLANQRLSYEGEVMSYPQEVTWEQIEPALPPAGVAGRVAAEDVSTGVVRECLLDPSKLVIPRAEWPPVFKTAKVMVQPKHLKKLMVNLVTRGVFGLLDETEVIRHKGETLGAGLFGIGKGKYLEALGEDGQPLEILRLIINMVASNELQRVLAGDIRTMPFFGQWLGFEVWGDEVLAWCSEDMKCAFYVFRVPRCWWPYFAIKGKAPAEWFGGPPGEFRYLCAAVVPMGWLSAVGACQHFHRFILQRGPSSSLGVALPKEAELRKDRALPTEAGGRVKSFYQVYIDNFDAGAIVARDDLVEREKVLDWQGTAKTCIELVGAEYSDEKRAVFPASAMTLGATIDRDAAIIHPGRQRAADQISFAWYVLGLDWPPLKTLASLGGSFCFSLQFRRACMGIPHELWLAICGKLNRSIVAQRCGPEVLMLLSSLPLLFMDLRCAVTDVVSCSDASETGGGVCVSKGLTDAGERTAHAYSRTRRASTPDAVGLIELCGGIGGARRALELLGVKPSFFISVEKDKGASRVTARAWPDVIHFDDVRTLSEEMLLKCRLDNLVPAAIFTITGSPCQDLTGLNVTRAGVGGNLSSLVFSIAAVESLIKKVWHDCKHFTILENVASMGIADRHIFNDLRGSVPLKICPSEFDWARRPRFYWLNFDIRQDDSTTIKIENDYVVVKLPARRRPLRSWLEKRYHVKDADVTFPTFTRALRRSSPPLRPAGLEGCDDETIAMWTLERHRFPVYQYASQFRLVESSSGKEVLLLSQHREQLLGFRRDHTFHCMPTNERKYAEKFEDCRCSLTGNAFHCGVIAWLISQALYAEGLLVQLLTAPQLPSILGNDSSIVPEPIDLVRNLLCRQTHRGGELRHDDGPTGTRVGLGFSVDARWWRWQAVVSTAWKLHNEHINVLECRALGLQLRWRSRCTSNYHSKFVHLVDSLVTVGAHAKGRSSAKALRSIVLRNASQLLAMFSIQVLAFVRTDLNPADAPSRRCKPIPTRRGNGDPRRRQQ